MSTLYVLQSGARLEKEYDRIIVSQQDELVFRAPLQRISQVVLVGSVGVTTQALHALLAADVPLLLITRSGRLRGRLVPPAARNLPRRQAQFRRNDDAPFCLYVAKQLADFKIANQRTLALRLARRRSEMTGDKLNALRTARKSLKTAETVDQINGIEGHAARIYFAHLRQAFDTALGFEKRTRRPPRDPVNAILSLGYSCLTHAMMTALEAVGLDPYLGYFHVESYGRPALAVDMIEPFRPAVVDSLALTLFNHNILQPHHFTDNAKEGTRLTDRGLRRFFDKFAQRLDTPFQYRDLDRAISYRKLFEVQARRLVRLIEGDAETFRPFRLR